jgi:hypothetical protein
MRVREVSAELGISQGLVSRIATRLRNEGYLLEEAGVGRLVERDTLLDDWRDFYRQRAKRQRQQRLFLHARDSAAVMSRLAGARAKDSPRWGLSFHAGASLVAPFAFFSEVHVLLDGPPWNQSAEEFIRRMDLAPAKSDANVILVQPYYRNSWQYGMREIDGLPVVGDVQLYLDLSSYPRRGTEQAERIRDRILAVGSGQPAS